MRSTTCDISARSRSVRNFKPRGRAGSWFEIKNSAAPTAEVWIYDEIGYYGVSAADFSRELRDITASTIELHISSPGGDVFDGLAILNSLRQHKATVNVTVDGIAASAASFIAMAGDRVLMAPQAQMMIHDASGVAVGNAKDMQDMADLLEKTSENIAAVYAQRAGGTPEEWRQAMLAETWYSDQEAVDAGLADGIVGAPTTSTEPEEAAAAKPAPTNSLASQEPVWDFDLASLVKEAVA